MMLVLVAVLLALAVWYWISSKPSPAVIATKPDAKKPSRKPKIILNKLVQDGFDIKPKDSGLCYFDLAMGQQPLGRVVFQLFDQVVPKTCHNFRQFCAGGAHTGAGYKGSIFHRVINNFMIQGGDVTAGDGTGGFSIYGRTFEDENFNLKHDRPFLLSMANAGPNTNGSQFFVTTVPCPQLDGKHVVFGQVVQGQDLVKQIEQVATGQNNRPQIDCRIVACGLM